MLAVLLCVVVRVVWYRIDMSVRYNVRLVSPINATF